MMAEGSRNIYNTLWQPSVCGDKASVLETLYGHLTERMVQVENEIRKRRVWYESIDSRLQFLESSHRQHAASDHYKMQETSNSDPPYQEGHRSCQEAFSGGVPQKDLQETEEYKKLKEKNKELEERNKELLSKVMSVHKHSENMNDPLRLSAVLYMYEMLRLHEWEKFRTACHLTYKTGSSIIKKLFEACEKDIEQRTTDILEVLDIRSLSNAMINNKQEMMLEIRNLFRYSYCRNDIEFYSKIIMQAGIDPKPATQRQFALECCRIYCLLLLQEPPVKAVWNIQESPTQYLDHVDKKDRDHWRKIEFLWPTMKCGEQVIVKGVVWDEK